MAEKPRFVVDASGNVRDVRESGRSRQAASVPPGRSQAPPPQQDRTPHPDASPPPKPTRAPIKVIFIPVGLILTALIAALRFCALSSSPASHPDAAVAELNEGNRSIAAGDLGQAMTHLDAAIAQDPNFGEAYNSRGLVYEAQGNYEAAITDFDRAITLLPDQPEAYNSRGIARFATGDDALAIADFNKAIALDTNFAKAYFNRGLVHLGEDDFGAAIADLSQAILLSPEQGAAVTARARDLTPGPGRDFIEGVLAYEALTQSGASQPLAYAYRGLAYAKQDSPDRAIADLRKALDLGLAPEDQAWAEALLGALR